ncbi:MAG: hypothetical protein LBD98_02555, partial [Endomicrobium sp.]|nr:hypothetical protein [Endomicrobium sp.]
MIFHTTQKLNFSQRNGLQKINEVLQVNSMSDELRTALFNFCYRDYKDNSSPISYFGISREILYSDFFKIPLTDIPHDCYYEKQQFKKFFFGCEWNKIYDFFEFCFSKIYPNGIEDFTAKLNSCLEKENSGYRMLNGCVVSITDKLEIEEIKKSFNLGKDEIKKHLDKSIEFLRTRDGKEPDFRNSIKESISAVEYVVRDITGASTLGDGLNKL